MASKPNDDLNQACRLQNECLEKAKRITELEEIISRQTRQLTQLSQGLVDLRTQMDPELGQRQMHMVGYRLDTFTFI